MSISSMNQGFLVVFGDSYSSVGNRVGVPDIYADWYTRFSNGPVWDEYAAFNDDFTLINFAVGGALTNNSFVGSQTGFYHPYTDFVGQVAIYEDTFSGKYLQSSLKNDVVVIQSGSNDIFLAFDKILDGSVNLESYFDGIVSNIISELESLIEFGVGVPDIYADWYTRFSNGPVWDEYAAFNDDFTLINFAVGGALTNNSFVGSQTGFYHPYTDFVGQVAIYEDTFSGKYLQSSLKNDVVVIQSGSNDIFLAFDKILDGSVNLESYFDGIVSNIISELESLIEFGYKNFVIFDIPYFSILPALSSLDQNTLDALDTYIQTVNAKLEAARTALHSQYIYKIDYIRTVSLYDIFKTLSAVDLKQLLNIKAVYNPKVSIGADIKYVAQSDSDDYLYVDMANPSTRVHALIASVFSETLKKGTISINEKVLEELVSEYDLIQINSYNNYLYTSNSSNTGIINLKEYTIDSTLQNVGRLVAIKNSQV
ncbi:hypothetical protein AYI68_g3250 [Smittium mucronatum]|uniref:Thermolabile hemolysin n=1 Tax=Smittium mucronatum TaxID=133383 RepID=A0A1R0H0F3_9FUNG|nr:hypothetical protein AYI68_g3250 [Smittium mucronatum]